MATYDELGIDVKLHGPRAQKVKCPQCSHTRKNKRDPCLSVNLTTGAYNCHNCDFKGYATEMTTAELKKEHNSRYAKPKPVELPMGEQLVDWFKKERGIDRETLQYFKLSQSREWMYEKGNHPAEYRNCINFNYYRGPEKINVKYRDGLKCFKLVKDAELILYNLNALRDRTDMLICEGEIDCMSFYQAGHYGATSVPNGASKGARLDYLDNCAEAFDKMEKIIIAVDDDEAGRALKNELTRRLGKHRCWFIEYPEGCKDANEVQKKYGTDAVRKMWQSAVSPPLEHVFTMEQLMPDLDEIYHNGWPHTDPIGFDGFDGLLRFARGEVTTVTGIPGHGKGEFIDQIVVRLASRYGWKTGVFSFEEPAPAKTAKLCQKYVGEPYYDPNPRLKMNEAKRQIALKFVGDHFFFIDIEQEDFTIDLILEKAIELVLRKGIYALIVDPYTCIESSQPRDETETQYIGKIMGKLVRFAKKYGVHVFFVVHPTKMDKDATTGEFKIPNLYNCAGSANFFNKTYNGIVVYRLMKDGTTKVFVQKVKFSWNGKLGNQEFHFDVPTGRYAEINGGTFVSEIEYHQKRMVQVEADFKVQFPEPPPVPPQPKQPAGFPAADLSKWTTPLPEELVPF